MPIYGLTDRSKAFIRLARIKKGERDETTGSMRDLDYFRLIFSYGCEDVEAEFRKVYGDKPQRINFRLAFQTVRECWDAFYVAYAKGGLLAKAGSNKDGLYWVWYRDHATNDILVRDGRPTCEAGEALMHKPIKLDVPVYSYKNKKNENVPVFLEPEGRLNIVVPEVAYVNGKAIVGFFEFCPGSPRDIATISAELEAIEFMARQIGKNISGIPMSLIRRKEQVTKNIQGVLSRGDSWVVHIELTGEWGGRALTALEMKALPSPDDYVEGQAEEIYGTGEAPDLLTTSIPDELDRDFPLIPETHPAEFAETKVTPPEPPTPPSHMSEPPKSAAQEQAKPENSARPYDPETFRAKFLEGARLISENFHASGKVCEASESQRRVLASSLDTYCFSKDEKKRHEFLQWLTGYPSTKEMACEQVKTFFQVLKISGNDFTQKPNAVAVLEITGCYKYIQASKVTQGGMAGYEDVNE